MAIYPFIRSGTLRAFLQLLSLFLLIAFFPSCGPASDEGDSGSDGDGTADPDTIEVADPVFSPVSGSYKVQTVISLSTGSLGTIYYTTDGTDPTDSSTVYDSSSSIILFQDTTFKAVNINLGKQSNIVTAEYTATPYFPDFNLVLKTGTKWNFHWRWSHTVNYSYTDESFTVDQDFQILLGATKLINNITFYATTVTSPQGTSVACLGYVRWKYLAYDDMRLLGSKDGTTVTVLFDARNGFWPGQGFFSVYDADKILSLTQSSDTYTMSEGSSWSDNTSTYYPGTGTIYDPDPYSAYKSTSEVYKNGIGPYSWNSSSGSTTSSSSSGDHYYITFTSFQ